MPLVRRLVLDVLKPHSPDSLEFCRRLAEQGADYRVQLTVLEVDEHTETTRVVIQGADVDFEGLRDSIAAMGGSLHSIDEVEVVSADSEA